MHKRPVFLKTVAQDNPSFTGSQMDENEMMLLGYTGPLFVSLLSIFSIITVIQAI